MGGEGIRGNDLADRELGGLVETAKAQASLPHSKGRAARLGRRALQKAGGEKWARLGRGRYF
jgi:hypothetical protein